MHHRWYLRQSAPTVAIVLLAVGLLAGGHATSTVIALALAVGRIGWVGVAAARREDGLCAQLAEANTDAVTGLANRRRLFHHLTGLPANVQVTVAYLDCDGLKTVNDTFGHQVGDGLLIEIARRLRAACAPGDVLVHLSGDEFALATGRDQDTFAADLASIGGYATIGDFVLPVRASIGTCRTGGGDPELALGAAEAAMYHAKRGGGGIAHYDPRRDGPPRLIQPRPRHLDAFRPPHDQ